MQPLCFEWDSAGFVTPTNTGEDYTRYTMGFSICTSFYVSRVASEREIFEPISDLACGQDMSVIVRFCYVFLDPVVRDVDSAVQCEGAS